MRARIADQVTRSSNDSIIIPPGRVSVTPGREDGWSDIDWSFWNFGCDPVPACSTRASVLVPLKAEGAGGGQNRCIELRKAPVTLQPCRSNLSGNCGKDRMNLYELIVISLFCRLPLCSISKQLFVTLSVIFLILQ